MASASTKAYVKRSRAAVRPRGLTEGSDDMAKPRIGKPERRLSTKNANFPVALTRQRAGTAALAGHDQDDARALAVSASQEVLHRLMGLGHASSMKVYPRVNLQTTARQVALLPPVDRSERARNVLRLLRMFRHRTMFDNWIWSVIGDWRNSCLPRLSRTNIRGYGAPELQLFCRKFSPFMTWICHLEQILQARRRQISRDVE